MKSVHFLALLVPVLAFAAGDSAEVKRGWLGVYTDELSKPMLVALDIDHGVLVTEVAEQSPAARAEMEVGDVITSLDGEAMTDVATLRWAVRDRPDTRVTIKVRRRGKEKTLDVTLGVREDAEQTFSFQWPEIPREALQKAERALREVGPVLKREFERSDSMRKQGEALREAEQALREAEPALRRELKASGRALDSLRGQIEELRKELNELRQRLTEKQKSE